MNAKGLTPILNVSDFSASVAWFRKLGWELSWDWGDPPTFGCVCSSECEIFWCEGSQGGRGKGANKMTFGEEGGESADKGVWMSIWVDDVDAVHRHCLEQASTSHFRLTIWNGTSAKCTSATPTATSSASAAGSKRQKPDRQGGLDEILREIFVP